MHKKKIQFIFLFLGLFISTPNNMTATSYGSGQYGESFYSAAVPVLINPTYSSLTDTSVVLGISIYSAGIPSSLISRGICLSTTTTPRTNCIADTYATTGSFMQSRIGLKCNTTYYYAGYATNTTGIGYSADGSFTTNPCTLKPSATHTIITGVRFGCTDPKALNYEKFVSSKPDLCKYSEKLSVFRVLKYGMVGEDVKKIQVYLNTHGYTIIKTGAGSNGYETTKFGILTQRAVMRFQKENKLKTDGIVGPKTLLLMK